jgi:hypothetical protein
MNKDPNEYEVNDFPQQEWFDRLPNESEGEERYLLTNKTNN